ncbi:hypothetical protein ABVK25_006594 [Lepraria finkii]|uniref:Uncharacterized protein n=1 Tax=Lepraria finkii TaxID=1340010 RepID=A0ABR4B8S5_9LECA
MGQTSGLVACFVKQDGGYHSRPRRKADSEARRPLHGYLALLYAKSLYARLSKDIFIVLPMRPINRPVSTTTPSWQLHRTRGRRWTTTPVEPHAVGPMIFRCAAKSKDGFYDK